MRCYNFVNVGRGIYHSMKMNVFVPSRNMYNTNSHIALQKTLKKNLDRKIISVNGPSLRNKLSANLKIFNISTSFTESYNNKMLVLPKMSG